MRTYTLGYTLVTCLALMVASPASGEQTQITLRVPVQLDDLHPDVASVRVTCRMSIEEGGTALTFAGAVKSVDANGSVHYVDELKASVSPATAARMSFYRCKLHFIPKSGSAREAILQSEHTHPNAQAAGLPFYVVQNGGRVEMQGSIDPRPSIKLGGGVPQRAR